MLSLAISCPRSSSKPCSFMYWGNSSCIFFSSSRSNMALEDNFPSCIGTIPKCMWGVLVHVYARIGYILLAIILCKIVFGSFKKDLVSPGLSFSKKALSEVIIHSSQRTASLRIALEKSYSRSRSLLSAFVGHRALAIRQLIVEVRASRVYIFVCVVFKNSLIMSISSTKVSSFHFCILATIWLISSPFFSSASVGSDWQTSRQAYCSSKVVTF